MGPSTCRYGSKVSRNLGGFFRNNTTKFGGIQNETWAEAKPEGAGVRAAGGLYVGVRVCEACGFVCGVGQLLGRYGAEGSGAARGL